MNALASLYSRRYPVTLVYMLQNSEYRVGSYLAWYWRTTNFSKVETRRQLQPTRKAKLLLVTLWLGIALELATSILFLALWYWRDMAGGWQFAAALIVAYPVVWAHLVVLPVLLGRVLGVRPNIGRQVRATARIFQNHPGIKIAVAGSYGKTSMKELLYTVLSEDKKVAATPANKNVASAHAAFAKGLDGDEDVLVIEYGEGAPGDVARFTAATHPTHAIITGLAPAHLDRYKTLQAAGQDIFSVAEHLNSKQVYVNTEAKAAKPFMRKVYQGYSSNGALGWKVSSVRLNLDGTHFTLKKQGKTMELFSGLVGRHQLGPLSLVAALAFELGLSIEQIEAGMGKTKPFQHRMQPYELGGAWIIDDTYNGNIEGVRVGTALLRELPGKRKLYISPGLVDQGEQSADIHQEMGRFIAGAKPDVVILMEHSVTADIQKGLAGAGFKGTVRIEPHPLEFYTNLQSFVASGDLVLMQNDWPDNYA